MAVMCVPNRGTLENTRCELTSLKRVGQIAWATMVSRDIGARVLSYVVARFFLVIAVECFTGQWKLTKV